MNSFFRIPGGFRTFCVLLALALTPGSAISQNQPVQDRPVIGIGADSCSKWLKEKSNAASRAVYRQWVFGFISGINYYAATKAAVPDVNLAIAYIDEACTYYPSYSVSLTAAIFVSGVGGPKVPGMVSR